MQSSLLVPFGLKDDRLYEPIQVPNGKACGCVCPACKKPLWAKQKAKTPHFAHAQDESCVRGFETATHMAVKQIVAERMAVRLPALIWKNPFASGEPVKQIISEALVKLEYVALEQMLDDFKPDIVVQCDGATYLIEVAVTHFVDAVKQDKINRRRIPTFEIDVSAFKNGFTMSELEHVIFTNQNYPAQWKYHPKFSELAGLDHLAKLAEEKLKAQKINEKNLQEQNRKQHFERYKKFSPEEKLQINLKSIGLTEQQMHALSVFVPWDTSFGVPRIIWQSAVLAFIARVQKEQGWQAYLPCTANSNACLSWLESVFTFTPKVADGEKIAIWKYFKHLEQLGILKYLAFKDFNILLDKQRWAALANTLIRPATREHHKTSLPHVKNNGT